MGFTAQRTTSPTAVVLDPASGQVVIGGGVASAPTTGAELLDLIRRWAQSQPDLNGKQVKAEVTQGRVNVVVQEKAVATDQTSTVRETVRASFILNSPGASGDPVQIGTRSNGRLNYVGDRYCVTSAAAPFVTSAVSLDGQSWAVEDLAAAFSNISTVAAGDHFFGIAQEAAPSYALVFVSSEDGITWATSSRLALPSSGLGFQVVAFAGGYHFYSDGEYLYRSADMGTWSPVLLQYDTGGDLKKEIITVVEISGKLYALGRTSHIDNTLRRAALFVSADSGATWSTVALPGTWNGQITSMASGAGKIVAHSWDGVGYYSEDGGVSWMQTTHPDCSVLWADGFFFGVKTSYSDFRCFTSATGVGDWVDVGLPAWFSGLSSYGAAVWNGEDLAVLSNGTNAYIAFWKNGAWATTPSGPVIVVTPEDIATANAEGGVSFFQSGGADPAYLTNGVEISYPPSCEAGHTDARWPSYPKFLSSRHPNDRVSYFVASFNRQFYDASKHQWVDALTEGCKIYFYGSELDAFLNKVAYVFAGREAIWGGIEGRQVFFATCYSENHVPQAIMLLHISADTPAYLQLRSGGQYLNFVTGRLTETPVAETCLRFLARQLSWGDSAQRWDLHAAEMPLYGPGLNVYVPPESLTPITGGEAGAGQDYVSGDGYSAVPYNPFRFLAAGGMSLLTAPPASARFSAGFSEYTAPPLPFTARGGFTEAGSSVIRSASAGATLLHMGLPFETRG